MQQEIRGLSESQVIARREQGQGNAVQFAPGRTYLQILRKNAFTFINCVLFAIGILLILMGQMDDEVVTAGLVLMNVIVGVYQEGRAKRKLDQLALADPAQSDRDPRRPNRGPGVAGTFFHDHRGLCYGRPVRGWSGCPHPGVQCRSGTDLPGTDLVGLYVLGAPEVLLPYLGPHQDLAARIDAWTARGLRVVLFAHHRGPAWLHDGQGEPQLPAGLVPLALLSLSDELRPEAQGTLEHFADLVLMNDSFAALPIAFREGQRIVKGMEDVVRLC